MNDPQRNCDSKDITSKKFALIFEISTVTSHKNRISTETLKNSFPQQEDTEVKKN